ncbi:hypothetical protein HF086_004203 [Spodoptera exigua]|uniref:Uncharacterized protein n=1 Tax=Spodoptera exigua TaxID=7107 RepID=A0A922SHZ7_SPOEX|nr:hypothetical protein HF086_004203 [Spodoptera exigua]
MMSANKNSYLQLQSTVNPRLVNKAVRRAMRKTQFDPHDEIPAAQRMKSMQPSLYGPCTDITRAALGFERVGLRHINRDINSSDTFVKLRAIHSLLDQVRISENAMFLVSLNVTNKLIVLLTDQDPVVREKVCLILTILGNYYQARKRIMAEPDAIDNLMFLIMRDRKEIRYAAARCLTTLTRFEAETIIKSENIVENLVKMVKHEHEGIVLLHLESLTNLAEWNPELPLKANAFKVMLKLILYRDNRIIEAAMNCLMHLCKHEVGQKLADKYDLTHFLIPYLESNNLDIIISSLGLMAYTTVRTSAKWRVKEFIYTLSRRIVFLCITQDIPVLQLRAMQVLINMCDCSDIREFIKGNLETYIIDSIKVRTPEQWDGTTEPRKYGIEFSHDYRTRYIEGAETIKNDTGDYVDSVSVSNYLQRVRDTKEHLLKVINCKPYLENEVKK